MHHLDDDLAAIFADPFDRTEVVLGNESTWGKWNEPGRVLTGDDVEVQLDRRYLEIQRGALSALRAGSALVVDGVSRQVREIYSAPGDGRILYVVVA